MSSILQELLMKLRKKQLKTARRSRAENQRRLNLEVAQDGEMFAQDLILSQKNEICFE